MTFVVALNTLANFLYSAGLLAYCTYLSKPRFRHHHAWLAILAYFGFSYLLTLSGLSQGNLALINILSLLFVSLLYVPTWLSLFYLLLFEAVALLADAVTFSVVCWFLGIEANPAHMSALQLAVGNAISKLVFIPLLLLAARRMKKVTLQNLPLTGWIFQFLLFTGIIYLLFFVNYIMQGQPTSVAIPLLLDVLSNFIYNFSVILFFSWLSKPRLPQQYVWAPALLLLILNDIVYFAYGGGTISFVSHVLSLLAVSFLFTPWKRNLFFVALFEITSLLADAITFYIICIIWKIDAAAAIESTTQMAIGGLASKVLAVLLLAITSIRLRKSQSERLPTEYWLAHFLVPAGSAYLLFYINETSTNFSVTTLLASFVVLGINVLILYSYGKTVSTMQMKMTNQRLQEQINAFNSQQAETLEREMQIRGIKHDLKNSLIPIQTALKQQDYSTAEQAFNQIIGGLVDVKAHYTSLPYIDSVLSHKRAICKKEGIQLQITPLLSENLSINFLHASIMLGAALDNAIEACTKVEQERIITVKIIMQQGVMVLCVSNPFVHSLAYDKKGELVTTKADVNSHGFGLRGIRRLIEEEGGNLFIETEGNLFTIKMLLYGEPLPQLEIPDREPALL